MLTFSQCFGSRYSMTSLSEYTRATISVGAAKVPQQATANAFRRVLCPIAWGQQPYRPHVPRSYRLPTYAVWALLRLGLTHPPTMIPASSAPQTLKQILRFAHNVRIPSQCISSPQEGFLGIQFLCHPAIAINFCNYL
jgi:hypothetical protein